MSGIGLRIIFFHYINYLYYCVKMSDMWATEALYDVDSFNMNGIDYRGYKH